MPCSEIIEAMAWAKQSTATKVHPVTAFLTIHVGMRGSPGSPVGTDICIYGYGPVTFIAEPRPRLAGDLLYFGNGVTMVPSMKRKTGMTIGVEVFEDGMFSYQFKFKKKPVAGMPTKVTGTCVDNVLLTTVMLSDVITIGLRRDPVRAVG